MSINQSGGSALNTNKVRFSARNTWALTPYEYWATANNLSFLDSSDANHPDREGIIGFEQNGHLFIQTQLLAQERFSINVRLDIEDPATFQSKLRIRFHAFENDDITKLVDLNIGANIFSILSPLATWPDSVALYIDVIDPASGDTTSFNLVYCDLIRIPV